MTNVTADTIQKEIDSITKVIEYMSGLTWYGSAIFTVLFLFAIYKRFTIVQQIVSKLCTRRNESNSQSAGTVQIGSPAPDPPTDNRRQESVQSTPSQKSDVTSTEIDEVGELRHEAVLAVSVTSQEKHRGRTIKRSRTPSPRSRAKSRSTSRTTTAASSKPNSSGSRRSSAIK